MRSVLTKVRLFSSNLPLRHKGLVVVITPVIGLLVSTGMLWYAQGEENTAQGWVKHTLQVQEGIQTIVRTALDAESSVRGYVISGDDEWLVPYHKAHQGLPNLLTGLQELVQDNAVQSVRARSIRSLADGMLGHLDAILPFLPGNKTLPSDFLQWQKENKRVLDGVRHELDVMLAEEGVLLNTRTAHRDAARQTFNAAVGISILLGLLWVVLATRLFTSEIAERIQVLEANATRLEQGLTFPPLHLGRDEIGRLGTAMERASQLLAERSDRLKLALKASKIAIWEMDTVSGTIRYEGEQEFLEGTAYAVAALPPTTDAFFQFIDPQDRPEAQRRLAYALETGTEYRGEYRVLTNDKTVRWMAIAARHYARDGSRSSFLGILMDVSGRKHAEEIASQQAQELATSEQKLREQSRILQCVVDSMGDGVVVADTKGKFLLFNPAAERMLGVGAVETTPDQWTEQYGVFLPDKSTPYPPEDLPLARAIRGESVDGQQLFVRNAILDEGGWISTTARPLKDEAGTLWGGVVVIGDITERKDAEAALHTAKEEAENANRAKSEFLSRMSHELRTPLNAIIGFAQVLEMTELSERTRARLAHILKAGRHLLGLVEEVLDISRIEARRLTLSVEPLLAIEAMEQAIDLVRPIAANAGVRPGIRLRSNARALCA